MSRSLFGPEIPLLFEEMEVFSMELMESIGWKNKIVDLKLEIWWKLKLTL
jgi:hypothetical protein